MKSTQKVLKYIQNKHPYVPFSGRWISEEFGERKANIALKQLSQEFPVHLFEDILFLQEVKIFLITLLWDVLVKLKN